ncbi:MAG: sugar phosphate isomerase/epimerase family protein, partial [Planctomycetaceae bacterium]
MHRAINPSSPPRRPRVAGRFAERASATVNATTGGRKVGRRALLAAGFAAIGCYALPRAIKAADSGTRSEASSSGGPPLLAISLAEWSLHKTLFSGKLDNLDFPRTAKREFGIDAVEYVNQFFKDRAKDFDYLAELTKRAEDEGVKNLLIMCDGLGNLGDPDASARTTAIENHFPWVEAAKRLGCHSIRVNAASNGSFDEQQKLAADGLSRLSDYAAQMEMAVIVENHGGLSSNGEWLAGVMKLVGKSNCGTLPD